MKIGFLGLLTLLLIALKLTGVIAVSWWVVMSPLIVGAILAIVMTVVFLWALRN